MDYLDQLIQLSRIEGKINVLCRFQGNWAIKHPKEPKLIGTFHIVSKGQCQIRLKDKTYDLKPGDVIFLPYGDEHIISYGEYEENCVIDITKLNQGSFTLYRNTEDDNHHFEMFCGYFSYLNLSQHLLFKLPHWYLSSNNSSIMALLELLRKETILHLGNQVVIDSLCNILFTYLIRDYLQHHQINTGILTALQDKRLSNAINVIIDNPERSWNMENLAQHCAMSRANFIRLFKQKTGILPGKFLSMMRINKAEILLKTTQKPISTIALEVGYQSETHFSKVFKEYCGISPGKYR